MAALFIIDLNWKLSKCPSGSEGVKKQGGIVIQWNTMLCYAKSL